jgi:transposase
MILHPVVIGIDVSKHHLDLFEEGGGSHRLANTPEALQAWSAGLAPTTPFVVFEATGSYDAALRQALAAAGIAYARVNPQQVRAFARALGQRAKTDPLDARILAEFGRRLTPRACPAPQAARERLALWHKRRDQLVAMRQQERTRRSECQDQEMTALLDSHIALLTREIAAVEHKLKALVAADEDLSRTRERLQSVPGVGPVTATTLLALLPELGQRSPKALAALAGLAPFNHDSGQRRGTRQIRGGRKRVRDALYMAAVSAAGSNTRLAAFVKALRQAGKPPKLALIALARKILVILNALIRDNTSFKPT